jgi:hypothetical protein
VSVNAAMLKAMRDEGLSLDACIRILEAGERKADRTNAERQARHRTRKRNAVTVTVTPPNDIDTLTPEVSEPNGSSPQPWVCPVGVDAQVWKDFLGNRKRKRQGNTPTAWKRFADDLGRVSATTGIPPPKLIEHAAASGWAGIYDPTARDQTNERPSNPTAIALQRLTGAFGH